MLAEALTEYESSSFCGGCGQLKSEAWHDDTAGSWERATIKCHACAADAAATSPLAPGELPYLKLNQKDVEQARKRREFMEANPDFKIDDL